MAAVKQEAGDCPHPGALRTGARLKPDRCKSVKGGRAEQPLGPKVLWGAVLANALLRSLRARGRPRSLTARHDLRVARRACAGHPALRVIPAGKASAALPSTTICRTVERRSCEWYDAQQRLLQRCITSPRPDAADSPASARSSPYFLPTRLPASRLGSRNAAVAGFRPQTRSLALDVAPARRPRAPPTSCRRGFQKVILSPASPITSLVAAKPGALKTTSKPQRRRDACAVSAACLNPTPPPNCSLQPRRFWTASWSPAMNPPETAMERELMPLTATIPRSLVSFAVRP